MATDANSNLALNGGTPVRTEPLPLEFPGAHWIGKEEINLLTQVIQAKSPFRYYGIDLQHMVDELETTFEKKWQRKHALGVNSGTSALHIALGAMGVGPGDEVLLPGYMWVSCVSAIVRLGAIPKLVDINQTFCMDPEDLKKKITPHSKVVLVVHMSGAAGQIDALQKMAKENNLYLLEDCAQATGAKFHDKYAGSFGDMAIFSFQLNKNMTSGEGGMIICDSDELYNRAFAIHDLGYTRNEQGRLDTSLEDYQLWGVGSRMSEITAACALAQLRKLDQITSAMHDAKWKIRNALQDIEHLGFRDVVDPDGDTGPFLITVYEDAETCDAFTKAVIAEGLQGPPGSLACLTMHEWGLHWYFNIPSLYKRRSLSNSDFPWSLKANAFASQYNYNHGSLPACDDLASRSAILTIASCLTEKDINDIVTIFRKVAAALLT